MFPKVYAAGSVKAALLRKAVVVTFRPPEPGVPFCHTLPVKLVL
jgi:hypothetical protein